MRRAVSESRLPARWYRVPPAPRYGITGDTTQGIHPDQPGPSPRSVIPARRVPWGMRQVALAVLLVLVIASQPPAEPTVRIGLNQNAATVTIHSASLFTVEQHATRSATFTSVLALDPGATGAVKK